MRMHFIGLMSGTSLDGVDGVLVSFHDGSQPPIHIHSHVHHPFAPALKSELLSLNARGDDELHRAALAANALARCYADLVSAFAASAARCRSSSPRAFNERSSLFSAGANGWCTCE